jgi:diguanylate cyclase
MLLFVAGFTAGAVVLGGLGFVCGRRVGRRGAEAPDAVEARQVQEWLGELGRWTASFQEEVARFRSEMEGLSEQADEIRGAAEPPRPIEVLELLSQMLSANDRLQDRVHDAESRLHRQSEELDAHLSEARTDNLTNLPNRRALDEELNRRMAEWRRYQTPFSLALLDIDLLQDINDRFGRAAGDRVLHDVGAALRSVMRDADLVARFDGEEFAIVMPATTHEAAHRAVERARMQVERITVAVDGQEIRPTVSCGVAHPGETEDPAELLLRVDAALYSSKCAGRNQSHWHDGVRCAKIAKQDAEQTCVVG